MSTSNGINIGDLVTLDQAVLVAITTGEQFKVVGISGDDRVSLVVDLPNGVSGKLDFVPAAAVVKAAQLLHVGDKLTTASPEPAVGTVLIDRADHEVLVRKPNGDWISSRGAGTTTWPGVLGVSATYEVIAV